MPRVLTVLLIFGALLVPASALAQTDANGGTSVQVPQTQTSTGSQAPFQPLPQAAQPTDTPDTSTTNTDDNNDGTSRGTLYILLGVLLVVLIGVATFIARDARAKAQSEPKERVPDPFEQAEIDRRARKKTSAQRKKQKAARAARKKTRARR